MVLIRVDLPAINPPMKRIIQNQNADEAQNSQNDDDWDDDGIAETEENWVANTLRHNITCT